MTITQGTMVDIQTALNLALSLVAFLGGWLVKTLFDRIHALEKADKEVVDALNNLRVELPSHYVNKSDFQQMGDSIFAALRRIEDKIDQKADKA